MARRRPRKPFRARGRMHKTGRYKTRGYLIPSGMGTRGTYGRGQDALFYKSPQTIPAYFNTIVKWTLLYSLAAASSAPYLAKNIVMNDLNDPGGALAATRPRYVTDLLTMYGRYIVHGFAIRMVGTAQPDTTSTGDLVVGCFPCLSAAQAGNVTNTPSAIAAQGGRWQVASRYGNQISKIKNYVKLKRILGYKDLCDDANNVGQSSAPPVNAPVMTVFAGSQDITGNAGFNLVISCKFYVTFFRRDNENLPAAV